MPDTKISAMVPATTPLVGTETFPLVQGGSNRKCVTNDFGVFIVNYLVTQVLTVQALVTQDGSGMGLSLVGNGSGNYFIQTDNDFTIQVNTGNLELNPSGGVNCNGGSFFANGFNTIFDMTTNGVVKFTCNATTGLQMNGFTGFTGTFVAGTKTVTVKNGIITSVV